MDIQFKEWWKNASKTLKCDQYNVYEIWQESKKQAIPDGFVLVEKKKHLEAFDKLGTRMVETAKHYYDESHIRGFGNTINFIHKSIMEGQESTND